MGAELAVTDTKALLRYRRGPCRACERDTELFFGKLYCDACAERLYAEYELRQARNDLLTECERNGWLTPEVLRCRFSRSNPTFEDAAVYTKAKAWRVGSCNVYIHGAIGCGKSFLAQCLLNQCYDIGKSISKLTALEFSRASASGYQSRGVSWLYGPFALLIDDVDKAPWNATSLGWLWQLIDTRRNLGRATILTSNFSESRLVENLLAYTKGNESLPTAIFDRLRPCQVLELTGPSLRRWQSSLDGIAIVETGETLEWSEPEPEDVPF